jgi:hypothetical protein
MMFGRANGRRSAVKIAEGVNNNLHYTYDSHLNTSGRRDGSANEDGKSEADSLVIQTQTLIKN